MRDLCDTGQICLADLLHGKAGVSHRYLIALQIAVFAQSSSKA